MTPGAVLADAAPAPPADMNTMPPVSSAPVSTVAPSALNPCLTRMPSPIIRRGASPPGCRSLYLQALTPIAHPLCSYHVCELRWRHPCRAPGSFRSDSEEE